MCSRDLSRHKSEAVVRFCGGDLRAPAFSSNQGSADHRRGSCDIHGPLPAGLPERASVNGHLTAASRRCIARMDSSRVVSSATRRSSLVWWPCSVCSQH